MWLEIRKEGLNFSVKTLWSKGWSRQVIFDEKNGINQIQSGEKGTLKLKNHETAKSFCLKYQSITTGNGSRLQ